jgi:hypothetical protein
VQRIQAINTTITTKAGHSSKVWELKDVVEGLQSINFHLFNPDNYAPYYRYHDAVQRNENKTRLDELLHLAVRDIAKDLRELIEIEHMTHDGRLVRNPVFASKPHLREWIEPCEVERYLNSFGSE